MSDFDVLKIISNKSRAYQRDLSSGGRTERTFSSRGGSSQSKGSKDSNSVEIKQPTILLKARDTSADDNAVNLKKKVKENEQVPTSIQPKESEVEQTVPLKSIARRKKLKSYQGPLCRREEHPNQQPQGSHALPKNLHCGNNNPPLLNGISLSSRGSTLKLMKKSMKLIDDGIINTEHLQDYLQENNDFIVIGVVGAQGVGKSTILNLLTEKKVTEGLKKTLFKSHLETTEDFENGITILTQRLKSTRLEDEPVFKTQTLEDVENCINTTQGIDIFVSSNRVIFLDCQPFLSVSVLYDLIESENKKTNLVSEFVPLESAGEIQGLQYTAFLMSVCHIFLVVQDWFFDSNVVRFIQSAEMLKPTISNPEDEYSEHLPHLIMIHNKAQMADFTPKQFKIMQKVYQTLFQKTKLQFHSNLGLGSGRIVNTLDPENCGNQVNIFLIPEYTDESEGDVYCGHPPLEDLIKRLRANLFGATKNSLTHVQLTEKTWLVYCNKVWETVKKSPFFVEYTKLMP